MDDLNISNMDSITADKIIFQPVESYNSVMEITYDGVLKFGGLEINQEVVNALINGKSFLLSIVDEHIYINNVKTDIKVEDLEGVVISHIAKRMLKNPQNLDIKQIITSLNKG